MDTCADSTDRMINFVCWFRIGYPARNSNTSLYTLIAIFRLILYIAFVFNIEHSVSPEHETDIDSDVMHK